MNTYSRVRMIGEGAQGKIWHVTDGHGNSFAMKHLKPHPDPAIHKANQARFEHEIKCHVSLDHPNIMKVIEVGETNTGPYFVMPLAEAQNLRGKMKPGDRLPEDEALRVFGQVLAAVAFAHEEGIIHRDLKPENVVFMDGRAIVTDFGLGVNPDWSGPRLTESNFRFGTEVYAAPEAWGDALHATSAADVYSLAIMLAELLTGELRRGPEIDYDGIPSKFRYLILNATQKEAAFRYPRAGEMRNDFEKTIGDGAFLGATEGEATRLVGRISNGDADTIESLYALLFANPDDAALYLNVFAQLQSGLVSVIAHAKPDLFPRLLALLDRHSDGIFATTFVERLSFFLRAAFQSTSHRDSHELILRRLASMAALNDNLYPAERFVELYGALVNTAPYPEIVADILRKNRDAAELLSPLLAAVPDLPLIVCDLLSG